MAHQCSTGAAAVVAAVVAVVSVVGMLYAHAERQ